MLMTVFFDYRAKDPEFLPEGQMKNKDYDYYII